MPRSPTATGGDDPDQATELRTARRRATGLLAAVAVAFVASLFLPDTLATGYLRAALEAGLVGGLADWFAVVALFRHPLGLPIPHTAVIPRSKDGLGANLARFVRDNFLATDEVRARIADPTHVERLGGWLATPANAERVAAHLLRLTAGAVDALDERQMIDRLTTAAHRQLASVPVARLTGVALQQHLAEGRQTALVTAAIDGLLDTIEQHRPMLRRRVLDHAPTWVPDRIHDLVVDRAEDVVRTFLRQLAEDPDHEVRRAIDAQLRALADDLQHDSPLARQVDAAARGAVGEEQLRSWIASWWGELRTQLTAAADPSAGDTPLRRATADALATTGRRLEAGGALHDRVLAVLEDIAPQLAATGQGEVESLITATIDRWDPEDTATRLELWMGRDLQFVRINGTLVGAVVGLVLHAVTQMLG